VRARAPTGGFATLATVLVLLALAAWGAAASQRTLLSEWRASAAHARAAQAFEAAQGGLDFALALLRAGPVDAACMPGPLGGAAVSKALEHGPVEAACRRGESGWACGCAALATPAPLEAGAGPAFRVLLQPASAPGLVQVKAIGCSQAAPSCPLQPRDEAAGHAESQLTMRLAETAQGAPDAPEQVTGWRRVPGSWRDF